MPGASAAEYSAYHTINIETSSQGKLIIMLYNGAIQRAEEAKRQLDKGTCEDVHNNLVRAQDIIAELRGSLNMTAGEIARNLDRIYEYFQHLLIKANIRKEAGPIDECIELLVSMRNTWQELFNHLAKEEKSNSPPKINVHGSGLINVQG